MSNLVCSLLNRLVTVESSGLKVSGRLIGVSEGPRGRPHKPMILHAAEWRRAESLSAELGKNQFLGGSS